jgi:hypothetical protein
VKERLKTKACVVDPAGQIKEGRTSLSGVVPSIAAIRRRTDRFRPLANRKGAKRKCNENESGSRTENAEK